MKPSSEHKDTQEFLDEVKSDMEEAESLFLMSLSNIDELRHVSNVASEHATLMSQSVREEAEKLPTGSPQRMQLETLLFVLAFGKNHLQMLLAKKSLEWEDV